ncbi:hypothetical protein B7486_29550 [cyanobacterium TDX16]|nr:hypothetical protein B7486_29550 [cyanobacterium TDX16]
MSGTKTGSKASVPFRQMRTSGLDVLFGEPRLGSQEIEIGSIVLGTLQPRKFFDESQMEELVASVREVGILEPLIVRPQDDNKFELVAGERRLRAASIVGLSKVPVIVKIFDDDEALKVALMENLLRADLNPIEEVEGLLQLLGLTLKIETTGVKSLLYGMNNKAATNGKHNVMLDERQQEVKRLFEKMGFNWESFLKNRLPLLNLPENVKDALRAGRIEYTKAIQIARIPDDNKRQELLQSAIDEGLSVAEITQRVRAIKQQNRETGRERELVERAKKVFAQFRKNDSITSEERREKLESLLDQIESLLNEVPK